MEMVYRTLGISRQAIWKAKIRLSTMQEKEAAIVSQVEQWRVNHPKMGSRPMYYSMVGKGIELEVGVNKFEQIVKDNNLLVGKTRTKKPRTSDGKGKENHPNLTNGLILKDINQLIVLDITYIWVSDKWAYIFSLKDVYSQRIVITPSQNMEAKTALICLESFIKLRGKQSVKGCIHHSDNGSQYNWGVYKRTLLEHGFLISRSTRCKENGSIEQLHHVSKNMYLEPMDLKHFDQLKKACKEVMHKNNHERAIKQLGWMTPHEFEKSLLNLPKESRIVKRMHDFDPIDKGGFDEA
jgi:transposase InsO family protein